MPRGSSQTRWTNRLTNAWRQIFGRFADAPSGQAEPSHEPETGQATGPQVGGGIGGWASGEDEQLALMEQAGGIRAYRLMEANPTIAMAMAASLAPIRSAELTYHVDPDRGEEAMLRLIRQSLEPAWPSLLRELLRGVGRGCQAFELVWGVRTLAGESVSRLVIDRFKPLLPELTRPLTDPQTGAYTGLTNQGVSLPAERTLWYAHEPEGTDLLGRGRHENARASAWLPWLRTVNSLRKHNALAASPIPMIHHPDGETLLDEHGREVTAYEAAQRTAGTLKAGYAAILPHRLSRWADPGRGGSAGGEGSAWKIEFLEPRNRYGGDFLDQLRHWERLMARGWLVPERTFQEGEHGTKAESLAHASIALQAARLTGAEVIAAVQKQVVDRLLAVNFGPDAIGAVRLRLGELVDATRSELADLMRRVLADPRDLDTLKRTLDVEAALDRLGWPRTPADEPSPPGSR